ncbi:hypothetical protein [Paenibacillus aquistagni]|uniref:hypothetical protein n=1 Tax=Paenibacillus aquistagni TaxID=1852522 RepID=UPI0015935ACD|nr:hypothetical protein [Paenibacillus aquistagni]
MIEMKPSRMQDEQDAQGAAGGVRGANWNASAQDTHGARVSFLLSPMLNSSTSIACL